MIEAIKEISEIKGNVDEDIDIAGRLFAERFKRGWSQTDLSSLSSVNPATISKIEAARVFPRISTLRKLAAAFGIPVSDLLQRGPVTVVVDEHGTEKKLGRILPPKSERGSERGRASGRASDEDHEVT